MANLPKKAERFLTASLALTVGSLALAGCGGQSRQTQAEVKGIIQPLMQKVAAGTLQLSKQRPENCSTNTLNAKVELTCQNSLTDKQSGDIEVIMRTRGSKPDPSRPLYEDITNFSVGGDNDSVSSSSDDELVAPGGGSYAQNPSHPNDGWVGYRSGAVVIQGYSGNTGSIYDTTDPDFYTGDAAGNPTSPAATASYIVSIISGQNGNDFGNAVSAIEQSPNTY